MAGLSEGLEKVLGRLTAVHGPCEDCGAVPERQELQVVEPEGDDPGMKIEISVFPCGCAEKRMEDVRYQENVTALRVYAEIPERYQGLKLADFKLTDDNRQQFEETVWYVQELEDNVRRGRGIMMLGSVGTGKTSCGCWILERAIEKEIRCRYLSYRDFVIQVQRYSDWDEELESYIGWASRIPLVLIDDIGIVPLSERRKVFLSALVENRWKGKKATIFTCNPDDMKEMPGDSISRIKGMCVFTESKGLDYRSVK